MGHDDAVRCFVAIELPADVKRELASLSENLRDSCRAPVKWVEGEAMHLTLKFLGNVPASQIEEIRSAVASACTDTGPLRLHAAALGAFPSARNPRVVWVGLQGDAEALGRLAERIDDSTASLGFARESRPFTPHLTLGRVRQEATTTQRASIAMALENATPANPEPFDVSQVSIMRSQLSPRGARYTCLGRVDLARHED